MDWPFRIVLAITGTMWSAAADAGSFTVTSSNDSGAGSLRQAIFDANAASGPDEVEFDRGLDGQTVLLTSDPLRIEDDLSISGPGQDRLVIRSADPELDLIQISGSGVSVTLTSFALEGGEDGIQLSAGSNASTVEVTDMRVSRQLGDDAIAISGSLNRVIITRSVLGESEDNISVDGTKNAISIVDTTIGLARQDGIEIEGDGNVLAVENSTINGNGADPASPNDGIDVDGSNNTFRLTQTTISGNGEDGLDVEGPSTRVTVRHSTIAFNRRDGIKVQDATATSTVRLYSSVIAQNDGPDVDGTIGSEGYNLVGFATQMGGFGADGDRVGTPEHRLDAGLGPLKLQGGSTPVHALAAGSPAIDSGDPDFVPPPEHDQRGQGFPRVQGGRMDIGAFEGAGP